MHFKKLPVVLASAGLMSLAVPQSAVAGEIEDLKALVQQLAAEVKQMKAQQTQQAAPQAPAAGAAAVTAVAPKGAPAATSASVGSAQGPLSITVGGANLTLYGNADIYMNYMSSSSGAQISALQDGGLLRSRLGLRGDRQVADGYTMKVQLEQGVNLTNGSAADQPSVSASTTFNGSTYTTTTTTGSGRLFDRQAWIGLATPYGEFRAGRQNTAIFYRGDYIDYSSRTIGSMVNNFGVPSRYDGDLSYISPRLYGFQAEAHYAIGGANSNSGGVTSSTDTSLANMAVYQFALDYLNGPFRVGYAGLGARPGGSGTITYDRDVVYHNVYANYNYGRGKIYLTGIRSNNGGSSGSSTPLSNVGGTLVSNNPGLLTGTSSSVNTFYNIYQVSADYQVTRTLRVGALYGVINDTSNADKGATGWSIGGFYDVYQNTMLYALVESLDNESAASWRPSGSAGLTKNFSAADSTGQRINGAQVGLIFKF